MVVYLFPLSNFRFKTVLILLISNLIFCGLQFRREFTLDFMAYSRDDVSNMYTCI